MNYAIRRKLGARYVRHNIETHTGSRTGYYRIDADVPRSVAEAFLREHQRCVSVGPYFIRNRRLRAEKARQRL